nr:MAG TPA: hypothetical protein [Caudoviricetes sp.]
MFHIISQRDIAFHMNFPLIYLFNTTRHILSFFAVYKNIKI